MTEFWIVVAKYWQSIVVLLFGIGLALVTFLSSVQSQQQSNTIEKASSAAATFSEETQKLSGINIDISNRIAELTRLNNEMAGRNVQLSEENQALIGEVKVLNERASKIISDINNRAESEAAANKKTGELKFKKLLSLKDDDRFTFIMGGNSFSGTFKDFKEGRLGRLTNGKSPFSLRVDGDSILFSANITDLGGNEVAKITDNYWRPNPNMASRFNYDENGFEVIDNKGRVMLSVDMQSSDSIVVRGIFIFKPVVIFVAGKIMTDLDYRTATEDGITDAATQMELNPIFLHAGSNWLHRRIE